MDGCTLSGKTMAGAFVIITPSEGGIYKGTVYDTRRRIVRANNEGEWSILLAPSIVAGPYKISVGRQSYEDVTIPDRAQVDFARLI